MPFSATVTPGTTFTDGTFVTADLLNRAANPTVSIGDGSLPASVINSADFVASFGTSFRSLNFLPWGAFPWESFKSGTVSCADGVRTEPVRGWWVQPSGAAVNAERDATSPDTASGHSLKVYGAAAATALRVGTYLPPAVTTLAQLGTVVFSAYVYNGTGVSFTPSLELRTSTTDGDEGSLDAPVTVAGTACASGQWTRVSFTLTTSVLTNAAWKRGAQVALRITAGGGVLDNAADYICVAQAALDKTALSAAWIPNLPSLNPFVPGLQLPWPGESTTIPSGWLLCNGAAVSRTAYRSLFDVIGTRYGAGDGSTTFNLPDLRGSIPVGSEVNGASQSRMELELSGCSITNGSAYITVSSTANLRAGMGILGSNVSGTIERIVSGTQIKASAAATATSSPVTLRFSKLGTSDPQTIGAAGSGVASPARVIAFTQMGCSTNSTTTMTVSSIRGLACGMVVDCAGVPAGTTIAAFLSATTIRLSATATATASGLTATFRVDAAPEDQIAVYENLLRNVVMVCNIGSNPDSTLQAVSGFNSMLGAGWSVSGHAVVQANTYITSLDSGGTDFSISPATSGAAPGNVELTFSGGSLAATHGSTPGPRMVPQNWMIKY